MLTLNRFMTQLSPGTSKILKDSLSCSPPRKSLVKGERFIRVLKGNPSDEHNP